MVRSWLGRARLAVTVSVALLAPAPASAATQAAGPPVWPGEEMPLPLAVKTPAELTLKTEAERQYLIFNLLAGGKIAFDSGDFTKAIKKWETLLRLPDLTPAVEKAVRPLLAEAQRIVRDVAVLPLSEGIAPGGGAPVGADNPPPVVVVRTVVSGTVSGGGELGPGGTVVWLKRADGPTPRPRPGRRRVITQKNKAFFPRVLAVTAGTPVDFRNDDDFYHNVFSLSDGAKFDTGLYQAGGTYSQTFGKPGPVELLCNIHASMVAYVYVVDSPYYTQAASTGTFTIKGVPPGDYELFAWHEATANVIRKRIAVRADGATGVMVAIPADRRRPPFVPDKYGKPRQPNVGY
jgi:plastocyanin